MFWAEDTACQVIPEPETLNTKNSLGAAVRAWFQDVPVGTLGIRSGLPRLRQTARLSASLVAEGQVCSFLMKWFWDVVRGGHIRTGKQEPLWIRCSGHTGESKLEGRARGEGGGGLSPGPRDTRSAVLCVTER